MIFSNRKHAALQNGAPPIFIGATGGSGTRVLVDILQGAGIFFGSLLNESNDAIYLVPVIRKWIPRINAAPLSILEKWRMDREFNAALRQHRAGMRDPMMRWGVKNPRTILLLPYLFQRFPELKFVHMIRDGRDMALSGNQSQAEAYAPLYLGKEVANASAPIRSITYWAATNLEAKRYGAATMGDHYHLVRFEDLCLRPDATIEQLFAYTGVQADIRRAAALVRQPGSIGRWRNQPKEVLSGLIRQGREALAAFGYLDTD